MQVDDDEATSAPGGAQAASDPLPERGSARGGRGEVNVRARWRPRPEHAFVLMLGLLVLVVHDVASMLQHPFWLDEAWVAVTTRFPLSQLPATTSATPIGWSVVLRVFTLGGDQTSRLLPLAFAGAAVVVAYWFARRLDWRSPEASVMAGLLAGIGVLLAPAMLVRGDLKQYTTDACLALLALALVSRLERRWTRRGLVALSVCIGAGMLFSHTVAFVGVAAFGSLCLVQLARREWKRLLEAAAAGAVTAVLMLGVYVIFDARAVVPGLTDFWTRFYVPVGSGAHASIRFVLTRFDYLSGYTGLGSAWLTVGLTLAGLVTIFRLGRPVTALTVAALWPEMIIVSALRKYPFLDLRTSTFLFAITVVVAAIGVVGLCSLLQPRFGRVVPAVLVALAAVAFSVNARPNIRANWIPLENVRDQARYVAEHAAPADEIVVGWGSNFGFAYYWPIGHPARISGASQSLTYYPDQPRIIDTLGRNAAAVEAAVTAARTAALKNPAARIWLIRTHVGDVEKAAWKSAFTRHGLTATPVGSDGLWVAQLK